MFFFFVIFVSPCIIHHVYPPLPARPPPSPLPLPQMQASSRIIGRGGAFIKQLQRESGCKINTLKEVDLRSGLTARVMNVCGNNTSMSKGLYLIARKIASRWEYAPEWEGGDPTVPAGKGLPPANAPSKGGGSRGGPGAGAPEHPPFDSMDVDSSGRSGRRSQRSQRSRGRGERDDQDDHGRGDRDGGSRMSDRRGSGSSNAGGGGDRGSGRGDRYGRSGGARDGAGGMSSGTGGQHSQGAAPSSSPWTDPSLLASVVGASAAAAGAGSPSAVASAEAWQRLLGQIPPAARESLGISAAQVAAGMPATDVYGQILRGAQPPQQLQPAQVRETEKRLYLRCCKTVCVCFFLCSLQRSFQLDYVCDAIS